jgi:hypothetical protein
MPQDAVPKKKKDYQQVENPYTKSLQNIMQKV